MDADPAFLPCDGHLRHQNAGLRRAFRPGKGVWFPLCGQPPDGRTRKVGFAASEASLFRGASYLITPCGASDEDVALLERTAEALGFGRCVVTTPEKHDRMIAFTSQVPHALACAYVLSPQCPDHKGFSAGSYRDVSRVANINETLWTELFLSNAGPLTAELDTLIENLSAVRDAIHDGDAQHLSSLLRAGTARERSHLENDGGSPVQRPGGADFSRRDTSESPFALFSPAAFPKF